MMLLPNALMAESWTKYVTNKKEYQAAVAAIGGVQGETAPRLVKAGVDVLVSGSYIFHAKDPLAVIRSLKQLVPREPH